ncbi:MAG: SDR family oxidoreductase [Acidimicrobiia bacterium]|nr:SDR family oxidoreductase [Acidimicrobiia bacterium]
MENERAKHPTFLVVGATGGIGESLTRSLSASGARLILAARGRERLERLAHEVNGRFVATDATSFDAVRTLFEATGPLDGVVNLCGSILLKPAHLTSETDFHETMAVNLTTSFAIVKASIGSLRDRGGSIVLMSSAAASVGLANHEAISAAKAGVEGLVRSAAATYAPSDIRVNCVAPGLVDTPLAKSITSNETALKASTAMHPLRRIGKPDDVARVIEWLLGPEATWITGQTLGVDGGLARVRSRSA